MQDDSDADYSYFESQCSEVCVRNIHAYIVVEVLPENQISWAVFELQLIFHFFN